MFTGHATFLHQKLFIESCHLPIIPFAKTLKVSGRSREVLARAPFQSVPESKLLEKFLCSTVLLPKFLGYASTDGVSACSPLVVVEVAEAFHCSCL